MQSEFLTELDTKLIDETGGGQWELQKPLVYRSEVLGAVVTVPVGFVTDFATVPRLPLAYLVAGDTAHRPAVVHDYLCREGGFTESPGNFVFIFRATADKVFREAMQVIGVPWWRRNLMYAAVRAYALIAVKERL